MNTDLNNNTSTISKSQFAKWRRFIEYELGFVLPNRQEHWMKQAIVSVAQTEQLSPQALLESIQDEDKYNAKLRQQVFDAVLIPESRFFRHLDSLEFIGEQAKRARLDALSFQRQINTTGNSAYKVWSVGCSWGQEVWSLAMVLDDLMCPFKIYGSDVSQQVLTYAKKATYDIRELTNIPKMYQQYTIVAEVTFEVDQQLRGTVNFLHHNLFSDTKLFDSTLDMIICQNVLIYFRQFDQRDILSRLVAQLRDGGYLLLAPGEAVQWQHPQMRRVDNKLVNTWQKIG